jgi:hypothetical protein
MTVRSIRIACFNLRCMQVDSLYDEQYIVMVGIHYTKSDVFLLLCLCIIVMYILFSSCQLALFGYPDWVFFRAFSSLVRQMPRYNSPRRGTTRTLPKLIVFVYVLFVCKCVLYYCHRVATQLQLTNISISIMKCIPTITIMCTKHSDLLLIVQTIITWGKICAIIINVICIF